MPSISSTKIIFLCFVRDFCSVAGFNIAFNFSLSLKSEAFNSNNSEFVSLAKTSAIVVFPIPGEPPRRIAFFVPVASKFSTKFFITAKDLSCPFISWNFVGLYFSVQFIILDRYLILV